MKYALMLSYILFEKCIFAKLFFISIDFINFDDLTLSLFCETSDDGRYKQQFSVILRKIKGEAYTHYYCLGSRITRSKEEFYVLLHPRKNSLNVYFKRHNHKNRSFSDHFHFFLIFYFLISIIRYVYIF